MMIWKRFEIFYYKYLRCNRRVVVKKGRYHRPDLYQSDAELMEKWRAIKHGFQACESCYLACQTHGEFEDTNGELSLDSFDRDFSL